MLKFNDDIKFTYEQKNILRQYLREEWFQELNEKLNIYDEEATEDQQIYHISKYIQHYCMSFEHDENEMVNNFFNLLSHFKTKTYREFIRTKEGLIQLHYSGFNSGNAFYTGKFKSMKGGSKGGYFTEGIFITPDGKVYIKKISMDSGAKRYEFPHHEQSRYNGIIAHEVFECFGVESAKYLPGISNWPYYYVVCENFLDKNQELFTFEEFYKGESSGDKDITQSYVLKTLEENMSIRYKNKLTPEEFKNLISKLKLQYAKQAFIKRLIGIRDENLGNIAIVVTTNGQEMEIPKIDISPAFDFDISFDFGEELRMMQIKTDNGKTDIKSMIEEFRSIEGFEEFLQTIMPRINNNSIDTIINNSYESSKAEYFRSKENVDEYRTFLEKKFMEVSNAFREIYPEPRKKGGENR